MINKIKNKSFLIAGPMALLAGIGMWVMAGVSAVARSVFKVAKYSIGKIGLSEESGFGKVLLSTTRSAYIRTLEGLSTTVYAFSRNIRKLKHLLEIKKQNNRPGDSMIYQEVHGLPNPKLEELFNKKTVYNCNIKENIKSPSQERGKDLKPGL